MTTDPRPTEISLSPQTPAKFPDPLPADTATTDTAPASSPTRPTRADWGRIAIFGIPYAAFFLVGVPTWVFPASWSLTAINLAIDTVLLIVVLTFFARDFFPAFSYLRTHPFLKILLLFGLWILVVIVQATTRIALYGGNPPVAENQQQVINALNDGTLGLAFSFFVTVGVPLVEESSTATSSSASSARMRPHGSSHRSQRRCLLTCTLTSGRTSSHTCRSASS